ncbi:hypothetical protein EJ08DRAFT_732977 [Tothia fuscella]|uniref:Uncharacterized protein n=1 Tax=Tothia fuscella TaxID=1048955 RepID=A0A9P4NTI9_9PEZI|nr:hypothetical protein EJ08DRAFT_732977 [Tothia fuscella]
MGLPVWRSPSSAESRDAIKLEPTATAAARSPIRRRSSQTSPRSTAGRRALGNVNATAGRRGVRLRDESSAAEMDIQLRALRQHVRAQRAALIADSRGPTRISTPPPVAPEEEENSSSSDESSVARSPGIPDPNAQTTEQIMANARVYANDAGLRENGRERDQILAERAARADGDLVQLASIRAERLRLTRSAEGENAELWSDDEARLRGLDEERRSLTRERERVIRDRDIVMSRARRSTATNAGGDNTRQHGLERSNENRTNENDELPRGVSIEQLRARFHSSQVLMAEQAARTNRPPLAMPLTQNRRSRYRPSRPTTIENDYGHAVDPSASFEWSPLRSMAPLGEQTTDRSTAVRIPAYNTWDYAHLREGIEPSSAPTGAVRATESRYSGPEMVIAGDFPPLRRVGNRTIDSPAPPARTPRLPSSNLREVWSPTSPVGGLGDRARSFSPEAEWDTMLSTIAPDATLPSADSSFTSAAASASFSASRSASADSSSRDSQSLSQSHSASSSRTHLTVPSRSDDWTCETDEDMDETEVTFTTGAPNISFPHSPPPSYRGPRLNRSTRSRGTGSGDRTPYRRGPFSRSRSWRSTSAEISRQDVPVAATSTPGTQFMFDDVSSAAEHRVISGAGEVGIDHDLMQLEGILERLARRDDIPDELWIGAGLNPSLARNLDLFARREERERRERERERRERERL